MKTDSLPKDIPPERGHILGYIEKNNEDKKNSFPKK